jgi:hypothetical protein
MLSGWQTTGQGKKEGWARVMENSSKYCARDPSARWRGPQDDVVVGVDFVAQKPKTFVLESSVAPRVG